MRDLAVGAVADARGLEQRARIAVRDARQEAIHPSGPLRRRQHAAHALRLDQRRRQKVVAARLPRLAVGVLAVPRRQGAILQQRLSAYRARRSAYSAPSASANAVLKCVPTRIGYVALRQKRARSDRANAPPSGAIAADQRRPSAVSCRAKFGGEHEQPRPAVRPLERAARWLAQVGQLRRRRCPVVSCRRRALRMRAALGELGETSGSTVASSQ